MIQSIQRETIVEMLLNSLEAERYVRVPLLLNIVDELSNSERLSPASQIARDLLASLEKGSVAEAEFRHGIQALRSCVQRLSKTGLSETPGDALVRATLRYEPEAFTAA
jgi:hypothetical protein